MWLNLAPIGLIFALACAPNDSQPKRMASLEEQSNAISVSDANAAASGSSTSTTTDASNPVVPNETPEDQCKRLPRTTWTGSLCLQKDSASQLTAAQCQDAGASYTWNGSECLEKIAPVTNESQCSALGSNYLWDGTNCRQKLPAVTVEAQCTAPGFSWVKDSCLANLITADSAIQCGQMDGYVWQDGKCLQKLTPVTSEAQCQTMNGYAWQNNQCLQIVAYTSAEEQCKNLEGYTWQNGSCVQNLKVVTNEAQCAKLDGYEWDPTAMACVQKSVATSPDDTGTSPSSTCGIGFHVDGSACVADASPCLNFTKRDATGACVAMAWAPPVLASIAGGPVYQRTAVSSNGSALVVTFKSQTSTLWKVWGVHYDGSNWGTAQLLGTFSTDGRLPEVAMDPQGNGMAVWQQSDANGVYHIYAMRFIASSGSWEAQPRPIDLLTNRSVNPSVTMDANGNATVIWETQMDTQVQAMARLFINSTNTWADPAPLDLSAGTAQIFGRPQADGGGNVLAVWGHFDTASHVGFNKFNATTRAWGNQASIIEDIAGSSAYHQIAVNSRGQAIAVWAQQNTDGTYTTYANHFDGSNWASKALPIGQTGLAVLNPQIAIDQDGRGMAVWSQNYSTTPGQADIWANRFDGSMWGTATKIDATPTSAGAPFVAFNSNGEAIAVWHQDTGSGYRIFARKFSGTWGETTMISTNASTYPRIGFDANNRALVTWVQNPQVWAARLE